MSRWKEKESTEDYRALDIRRLHQAGVLVAGRSCSWEWKRRGAVEGSVGVQVEALTRLRLRYQLTRNGQTESKDYSVSVTWTECHLGGSRPWFQCLGCNRRVAKLYSSNIFACRHCLRLNYASQQSSKRDRALERSWDLRHRLGTDFGMYEIPAEAIPKPKGMHWRTFRRKIALLERVERKAYAVSMAVLTSIEQKLYSLDRKQRAP